MAGPTTTFNVRHDLKALEARLGVYPRETLAAAVRALNRTMTTVRAEAARSLGKQYPGLKIGTIKRQMKQQRASRAAPVAILTFSNKRFRLFGNWNIGLKQTRWGTGVRLGRLPFRLETANGQTVGAAEMRRFFVQRSRTHGVPNVWMREGKDSVPIQAIVAPSLSSALVERQIGAELVRAGRARFRLVLAQEMKFRLSKRGA